MLPARLRLVAGLVPPDGSVADIGSGHGAVASALARGGRRVIATELRPTTLRALRGDLDRRAVPVETRRGDGFASVAPGEVDVAVVAGIGGRNLVRILDSAAWLPRALILQPMSDLELVRAYLERRGWSFSESAAAQRGRTYVAFRVYLASA